MVIFACSEMSQKRNLKEHMISISTAALLLLNSAFVRQIHTVQRVTAFFALSRCVSMSCYLFVVLHQVVWQNSLGVHMHPTLGIYKRNYQATENKAPALADPGKVAAVLMVPQRVGDFPVLPVIELTVAFLFL